MKIKQLIPITMILISACASNSGDRRPSRPRNIISQEEIQGMATALNAYDIVSFPLIFNINKIYHRSIGRRSLKRKEIKKVRYFGI